MNLEMSGRKPGSKQSSVVTKVSEVPMPAEAFEKRVKALARLYESVKAARRKYCALTLEFAVGYTALYREVKGTGKRETTPRVEELNKAFNLNRVQASSLRSLAAQSKRLTPLQESLPAAPESLYLVATLIERDEAFVKKAVAAKTLTPDSTVRDIRKLQQTSSGWAATKQTRKRKSAGMVQNFTPTSSLSSSEVSFAKPVPVNTFIQFIRSHSSDSLVFGDIERVDETTSHGTFTITSAKRVDGKLPATLSPEIIKAMERAGL